MTKPNYKASQQILNVIASLEGLSLKKYICPAGLPTIGYGHVMKEGDKELITLEEAKEILIKDVARFEKGVNEHVKVLLQQREFDSLVCFSFNIGLVAFKNSTLLKLLNKAIPDDIVTDQFDRWVYTTKKGYRVKLNGLVKRRAIEKAIFLGDKTSKYNEVIEYLNGVTL